jgi:hypothetical protein
MKLHRILHVLDFEQELFVIYNGFIQFLLASMFNLIKKNWLLKLPNICYFFLRAIMEPTFVTTLHGIKLI